MSICQSPGTKQQTNAAHHQALRIWWEIVFARTALWVTALGAAYWIGRAYLTNIDVDSSLAWLDRDVRLFAFAVQIILPCTLPGIWRQSRVAALATAVVIALAAFNTLAAIMSTTVVAGQEAVLNALTVATIIAAQVILFAVGFAFLRWAQPMSHTAETRSLIELLTQLRNGSATPPPGIDFDGEVITATQMVLASATGLSIASVNRQIKAFRQAGKISADTAGGVTIIRLLDKNPIRVAQRDDNRGD